jgi:hypothetical protein
VYSLRRVCFIAQFVFLSLLVVVRASAQGSPDQGDTLVAIAPCRVLDTSSPAIDNAAGSRDVNVRASRCGRVVPQFAQALAVRVTRMSRKAPEKLAPGNGPVEEPVKRVPVPADGRLSFATSPEDILAVDLVGYYVPPGTPLSPRAAGNADTAMGLKSSSSDGAPANIVYSGANDVGSIYLNGGWWSAAGVVMASSAGAPWIVSNLGNSNGSSAFSVYSTASELMRLRSDGVVQLPSNGVFMDGRTDFFGTPGVYPGYVSIPTNIVHDVALVNPRDAAGGNTSRLIFFNASTQDESGSPPITKFQARTGGYHAQENVNFDSIVHWHMPNQYHFRAVSSVENKNTFWVKAATSGDSVTQTRADMYLSGRAGIGTEEPTAALHVEDLANDVEMIVSAGDNPGFAHGPTVTLMRKDGENKQIVKYGWRLDANDGNKFKLLYGTNTDAFTATLMTVDPSGTLTAKVVGAVYQDVAEWVPATSQMTPGTVVVLNPARPNEVMPSSSAYDTRVAGVVSEQPGLVLGVAGDAKEMIATTGRVKVHADASGAPIHIGDLLVASDKTGRAMRSEPMEINGRKFHQPGTIIGKALEVLESGQGEILMLLSLQ